MLFGFLFLIPVFVSLGLCFIRDSKKKRGVLLNLLIIGNALLYVFPLAYAYISTRPDGNMWSENGPGAILWLYFFILPICLIAFIVLVVLKLIFRKKSL
ncbi:hypothetical protein [Spongiimicrobium salis]|uniref:hypothetical protein n=1 Tax=Spongiimicrobium salis TaxID=1667022 RepID=UPI00374D6E31